MHGLHCWWSRRKMQWLHIGLVPETHSVCEAHITSGVCVCKMAASPAETAELDVAPGAPARPAALSARSAELPRARRLDFGKCDDVFSVSVASPPAAADFTVDVPGTPPRKRRSEDEEDVAVKRARFAEAMEMLTPQIDEFSECRAGRCTHSSQTCLVEMEAMASSDEDEESPSGKLPVAACVDDSVKLWFETDSPKVGTCTQIRCRGECCCRDLEGDDNSCECVDPACILRIAEVDLSREQTNRLSALMASVPYLAERGLADLRIAGKTLMRITASSALVALSTHALDVSVPAPACLQALTAQFDNGRKLHPASVIPIHNAWNTRAVAVVSCAAPGTRLLQWLLDNINLVGISTHTARLHAIYNQLEDRRATADFCSFSTLAQKMLGLEGIASVVATTLPPITYSDIQQVADYILRPYKRSRIAIIVAPPIAWLVLSMLTGAPFIAFRPLALAKWVENVLALEAVVEPMMMGDFYAIPDEHHVLANCMPWAATFTYPPRV